MFLTSKMLDRLEKIVKDSIVELDPEKRYMIIVPSEEGAAEVAKTIAKALDIKPEDNLRIVVVEGNIKILEFG